MYFQYFKCLGTAHPKSVVALESVIWKAIFDITHGQINVYAAVHIISDAIPRIMNDILVVDKAWFNLGLLAVT